jgi:transposase InsO family protein
VQKQQTKEPAENLWHRRPLVLRDDVYIECERRVSRDLLDRDFTAVAPRRVWVTDFTEVRTWGVSVSRSSSTVSPSATWPGAPRRA